MALEVRPVTTRRDLRTFIKLPWRLYRQEPNWVAPLLMDVKKRLDRKKDPFFKHAEAQYFLAYRDGRPVGRISAHIDQHFNSFHGNEWGLFGFFECEDDAEAAHALADAAEGWLRERGRDRMVGPMDFTTNDEIGLLIKGHEYPPIILCPWHHPYYQRIFEQELGMVKEMDVYMWSLHVTGRDKVHPAIWEAADKLESEHGIVCRNFRKKELQQEVTRFLEVYNTAWERNWGFVPLSEEEVRHYAKDLSPAGRELVNDRRTQGHRRGRRGRADAARLQPGARKAQRAAAAVRWLTALRSKRRIDAVRVIVLGVKPEYRHTGVGSAPLPDALRRGRTHTSEGGRGRLDPGGQRGHEPRLRGDGRRDQALLPRLRARVLAEGAAYRLRASKPEMDRADAEIGSTHRDSGHDLT